MNLRKNLNKVLQCYHKTEDDIEKIYYFPINTNRVLQLNITKTLELLENLEPDGTDLIKLQFKGNDFIIKTNLYKITDDDEEQPIGTDKDKMNALANYLRYVADKIEEK